MVRLSAPLVWARRISGKQECEEQNNLCVLSHRSNHGETRWRQEMRRTRGTRCCQGKESFHPPPVILSVVKFRVSAFGSVGHRRKWCAIGPFADEDHENSDPFFRVVRGHNRRAGQIGSPAFRCVARNKKHQMWMPTPAAVVQVLLLRHHVAHCSPLQRGQFLLIQCRCGRRERSRTSIFLPAPVWSS